MILNEVRKLIEQYISKYEAALEQDERRIKKHLNSDSSDKYLRAAEYAERVSALDFVCNVLCDLHDEVAIMEDEALERSICEEVWE